MLVAALFLAGVGAAGQMVDASPRPETFEQEATRWLLEGRDLPPDYRPRLLEMTPSRRLQAIVFLRRSGLLTGKSWRLDDILKPAARATEDEK